MAARRKRARGTTSEARKGSWNSWAQQQAEASQLEGTRKDAEVETETGGDSET